MSSSRAVDWADFLSRHDDRYAGLVCDIATGRNGREKANGSRLSYFQVRQLKEKLVLELRE